MGLKEKGRGGIYGGGGKKGELGGDKPRRDKDGGANRRGVNIARARRDENKSTVREQRATENQQPSKNEREKKKKQRQRSPLTISPNGSPWAHSQDRLPGGR